MEIIEKVKQIEDLEKEISKYDSVMIDGAIDNVTYFNSKFRIGWFLKEAYSDDEYSQNYRDLFTAENLYEDFFRNVAIPTWHPIIYISNSILYDFKTWQDLPWIKDDNGLCEVIKNIAIINANKQYSYTGTWTDDENLFNGFQKFQSIILKQIEILDPNVCIFCNTFDLYKDILEIDESFKVEEVSIAGFLNVFLKDKKIFIDAFHPAITRYSGGGVSKEFYFNSIVNAVKKLESKL